MFLSSLIEELCRKEENGKTGRNFNFGHECKIFQGMLMEFISAAFLIAKSEPFETFASRLRGLELYRRTPESQRKSMGNGTRFEFNWMM